MTDIADWWPLLLGQIRRVIVSGLWLPAATFSLGEIERIGGPAPDDDCWVDRDGDAYLPQAAVLWIIESADSRKFSEPESLDPRAAYFRRGADAAQGTGGAGVAGGAGSSDRHDVVEVFGDGVVGRPPRPCDRGDRR